MRLRKILPRLLVLLFVVSAFSSANAASYVCGPVYISCEPGYYLSSGSCLICDYGYSCSGGTAAPSACSAATEYQDSQGQSTCKTVSTGYYKLSNLAQAICSVGNYCLNGVQTACSDLIQYQDAPGQTSCKTVSSGYYKLNNTAQVECPTDYQSGPPAATQNACKPADCSAGQYWFGTGLPACTTCTAGNFCLGVSIVTYGTRTTTTGLSTCATPESSWTLLSETGLAAATECTEYINATTINADCYAGQLQRDAASSISWSTETTITIPFQADAGSYVSGSGTDLTCNKCTIGSYTAANGTQTTCTACDSGTTTSASGQTSCNSSCANNAHATSWDIASWDNNIVTNLCAITACTTGYDLNSNACEPHPYSITYNLDGGVDPGNPSTYTIETSTVTLSASTKYKYDFAGWCDDFELTLNCSLSKQIPIGSTGDKEFWAKWILARYYLEFSGNGSTGGSAPTSVECTYDSPCVLPGKGSLVRSGYRWIQWCVNSDGSGPCYSEGDEAMNLGDITIYAKWLGCGAATYSNTATNTCETCATGSYSIGSANATCTTCEVGNICEYGIKTACSGVNEWQDNTGQSTCKAVDDGYKKLSNSELMDCGQGYYCKCGQANLCPVAVIEGSASTTGTTIASEITECYQPIVLCMADLTTVGTKTCHYHTEVSQYCWPNGNENYNIGEEECIPVEGTGGCGAGLHMFEEACTSNVQSCTSAEVGLIGSNVHGQAVFVESAGGWNRSACYMTGILVEGAEMHGTGTKDCNYTEGNGGAAVFNTACVYHITCELGFTAVENPTPPVYCQRNTITINFDRNSSGGVGGTMNPLMCAYGTTCNIPTNNFKRAGYVFVRWCTEAGGTGTCVSAGTDVGTIITSGATTLYAQWAPCYNGKYSDFDNSNGQTCQTCPAGTYSANDSLAHDICDMCDAGYYCSAGSNTGAQNLCTAGNYCPVGTGTPLICTIGSYCPAGAETPTECPAIAHQACIIPGLSEIACSSGFTLLPDGFGGFICAFQAGSCTIGAGYGEINTENGLCELTGCYEDNHLSPDGQRCEPNTALCTTANGRGEKEWTGSEYGSCVETVCRNGYGLIGGLCSSCNIDNVLSYKETSDGTCVVDLCKTGYHIEDNLCVENTTTPGTCSIANGEGTNEWKNNAWVCTATNCNTDYHIESNTCVSNTKACTIANGVGSQTWVGSATSGNWDACQATSCNAGYTSDKSLTNEWTMPCGRCNNYDGFDGEPAVSSYTSGCDIAVCMYPSEKYILKNSECVPICETRSDETGSMQFVGTTCQHTCESGFVSW